MLMLTQEAALAIRELTEGPGPEGVRITATSMNGSGPQLQAEFSALPHAEDAVVDEEGVRLYVDPAAIEALDGKILDAEVEGGEIKFAVLEAADGEL